MLADEMVRLGYVEHISPETVRTTLKKTRLLPWLKKSGCIARRTISPLETGEEVEVIEMAPAEECEHEMFVVIRWKQRQLAVPLMQLEGIEVDEETQQAIDDWHYWVDRGYEF